MSYKSSLKMVGERVGRRAISLKLHGEEWDRVERQDWNRSRGLGVEIVRSDSLKLLGEIEQVTSRLLVVKPRHFILPASSPYTVPYLIISTLCSGNTPATPISSPKQYHLVLDATPTLPSLPTLTYSQNSATSTLKSFLFVMTLNSFGYNKATIISSLTTFPLTLKTPGSMGS